MTTIKYNQKLLDAVSLAKKGNAVTLDLHVKTSVKNSVTVDNAISQWSRLLNGIYSAEKGCKGTLNLNFLQNQPDTTDIDLTAINSKSTLSHAIKVIGNSLGLAMNYSFTKVDYIFYFSAAVDLNGYLLNNELIRDKDLLLDIYSKYGNPRFSNPVIYGPTNFEATNYNPIANKEDGTGIFKSRKVTNPHLNPMYSREWSEPIVVISSGGKSFYNLTTSGLSLNEFSGSNIASTVPNADNIEGDFFTESLTLPTIRIGSRHGLTIYKKRAGDFNISDRLGNLLRIPINLTDLVSGSELATLNSTPIYRNIITNAEVGINEPPEKIGSSNMYSITFTSSDVDKVVEKSVVLMTSPRELAFLELYSEENNTNTSGDTIYDCDNPNIPLGNILKGAYGMAGLGDVTNSYIEENIKLGYVRANDWFYFGMTAPRDAQGYSFPEPCGGIDPYMIFDQGAADEESLIADFEGFFNSHQEAGGSLTGWYRPNSTDEVIWGDCSGNYALETSLITETGYPLGSASWGWGSKFQNTKEAPITIGNREMNPNARTNKILPLVCPQSPFNINVDNAGFNPNANPSISDRGLWQYGDFYYVDNSPYNKGYEGTFLVFSNETTQMLNFRSIEQLKQNGEGTVIYDVDVPVISKNGIGTWTFGGYNFQTSFLHRNYVYYVKPDGSGIQYNHTSFHRASNTVNHNYCYMKGFSFDITNSPNFAQQNGFGLYQIASRSFVDRFNLNPSFSLEPAGFLSATSGFIGSSPYADATEALSAAGLSNTQITPDRVNPPEIIKLLSRCAIAMSFRKKSIVGTYMADPNSNPFCVMPDQPENTIGCYIVAYGIPHGIILMYMNEYGQFLPLEDSGVELHLPGGQWNKLSANINEARSDGGMMPISMVFSPGDNYLYTIVQHKETLSSYICIYDVSSVELGQSGSAALPIIESAIQIDNPFTGALSRVDRGADGCIYFFSHNSNEYIKITNPDQSNSVNEFLNFPSQFVKTVSDNFDFLPAMSSVIHIDKWLEDGRHTVISEDEKIDTQDLVLLNNPNIFKYAIDPQSDSIFDIHSGFLDFNADDLPSVPLIEGGETELLPDKTYFPSAIHPSEQNALTELHGNVAEAYAYPETLNVAMNSFGSFIVAGVNDIAALYFIKQGLGYEIYDGHRRRLRYYPSPSWLEETRSLEDLPKAKVNFKDDTAVRYKNILQQYDVSPDISAGGSPIVVATVRGEAGNQSLKPGSNLEQSSAFYGEGNYIAFYAFSITDNNNVSIAPFIYSPNASDSGQSYGYNQGYSIKAMEPSLLSLNNFGANKFTDDFISGMGIVEIETNSSWIFNLVTALSTTPLYKVILNKVDTNFDCSNLNTGSRANTVSFSDTVEYDITSDLNSIFSLNSSGLNNMTATKAGMADVGFYTNLTGDKVTIVVKTLYNYLNKAGLTWILFYDFEKTTGQLTFTGGFHNMDLMQRAYKGLNNSSFGFPLQGIVKKVVYSYDSSVVYLLLTNARQDLPILQTPIVKVNLQALEEQGLLFNSITTSAASLVDPFPSLAPEDIPADLNNPNWDPITYRLTQTSLNGDDYIPTTIASANSVSHIIVDNIYLNSNSEIYITSRSTAKAGITSHIPSIGRIVNSNYYDNAVYALNSKAAGVLTNTYQDIYNSSETDDIRNRQFMGVFPPIANGGVRTVNGTLENIVLVPRGCMDPFNSIGVVNCNYLPEATYPLACTSAAHNGPVEHGGTGYVDSISDPNFVECDCNEEIEPVCSVCYPSGTEAPNQSTTCGICTDPNALNYQNPDDVSGPWVSINSTCKYKYCGATSACNYVPLEELGTAPNGGIWVATSEPGVCVFQNENCNCDDELDPGYCGECGGNTYLQQGLEEGYCGCGNEKLPIPQEDLSAWQILYAPNLKYCDCEGSTPDSDYCDCNGTVIQGSFPDAQAANLNQPCNCAGETSAAIHGQYCDCNGNVNIEGACDCDNMPVIQYVDADGDGLGVEPGEMLCPIVNEDGSLSPQPGYAFGCCDTTPDCPGEYDACDICRPDGQDDPEYCYDGRDECGECCGNNECHDCHGVPNGPGATPDNPCPGTQWCECTGTYEPEGQSCATENVGCGCGQPAPDEQCGDCIGPDANGCCSTEHFDECLNECVPINTPITVEDQCGACFESISNPDFNSCVGCMDEFALNYRPDATVPCSDCCEYEEYVPPIIDIDPDPEDGVIAPEFTSGLVALPSETAPSRSADRRLPITGVLGKSSFDFDATNVGLTGWPLCVESGSCEDYSGQTVQIDNPSYSNRIQVVSSDYKIYVTNAHGNGEIKYYTDVTQAGTGYILNITPKAGQTMHMAVGRDSNSSDIQVPAIYVNYIGQGDYLNQLPSNSVLLYKPKFYFTFDGTELTTYDPDTLFYSYRTLIDKVVKYTLPASNYNAEELANMVRLGLTNGLTPVQTTVYDGRRRSGSLDMTPTSKEPIIDLVTSEEIPVVTVFEVTPVKTVEEQGYEEFIIDLNPFRVPGPPDDDLPVHYFCGTPCSPNYGIVQFQTQGVGASPSDPLLVVTIFFYAPFPYYTISEGPGAYDNMIVMEYIDDTLWASLNSELEDYGSAEVGDNLIPGVNFIMTIDNSVCEPCEPEDPCDGSYEEKCNDPAANNYVGDDYVYGECEIGSDKVCNYLCDGLEIPEGSPGVEGTPSCANQIQVCTDQAALNFFAVPDDNTACCYYTNNHLCEYVVPVYGCTNKEACNYDPNATVDDGSCDLTSCVGCTDPEACNYNPQTTIDDGSCYYAEEGYTCEGDPINPPPPPPPEPEPVLVGWRIKATIDTAGLSSDVIQKFQWVIYDTSQNLVKHSPDPSVFDDLGDGRITKTIEINDIMSIPCMWFLPLGVEQAVVWERTILEILTPSDNVYHFIRNGFTLTDTGSILLRQSSNIPCSFGCSQQTIHLNTEHCIKNIQEDSDEFTDITLQVETPLDNSAVNYENVKVHVIRIDSNEIIASVTDMYAESVFVDTFRLTIDTKLAIVYINPDSNNAPVEAKLIGEFGELITKKIF